MSLNPNSNASWTRTRPVSNGMKNFHSRARSLLLPASTLVFSALTGIAHAALDNPLNSQYSSIPLFIEGVLKVLVIVALPIISLFIVYSGFKFITAQGNSGKLDEAKKNFVYVIVGALLILGAWIIATLISGTVSQLTVSSGASSGPPPTYGIQ